MGCTQVKAKEAKTKSVQRNQEIKKKRGSGGCLTGDSLVLLANREYTRVDSLSVGDMLFSTQSKSNKVMCVHKTTVDSGVRLICRWNQHAGFTKKHPVRVLAEGTEIKWKYPITYCANVEEPCDSIYNLVMEDFQSFVVFGGLECMSLGQRMVGKVDDGVVENMEFSDPQLFSAQV